MSFYNSHRGPYPDNSQTRQNRQHNNDNTQQDERYGDRVHPDHRQQHHHETKNHYNSDSSDNQNTRQPLPERRQTFHVNTHRSTFERRQRSTDRPFRGDSGHNNKKNRKSRSIQNFRDSTINKNSNVKDKDPHKTELDKFDKRTHNVFEWLLEIDQILENRRAAPELKREILLERLSRTASADISIQQDVNQMDYAAVQTTICRQFMGRKPWQKYERYFQKEVYKYDRPIGTFFAELKTKWQQYKFALWADRKATKNDMEFVEYFVNMLEDDRRRHLKKQIHCDRVSDMPTLALWVDKNTEYFTEGEESDSTDSDQQQNRSSRRRTDQSNRQGLHNMSESVGSQDTQGQQERQTLSKAAVQEIEQAQHALHSVIERFEGNAKNHQKQINDIHETVREMRTRRERSRARSRSQSPRSYRYQGENRYTRNPHRSYDRQSPRGYGNEHQSSRRYFDEHQPQQRHFNEHQSYNAGRERSMSRDRDHSSRDRSHSPTPKDNKCYACQEQHWIISCPYTTRIERELELFKMIDRMKKKGVFSADKEPGLRQKYGCEQKQRNPYLDHDQKNAPTGSGHYCKWCHTRGHSTWICENFCPICETKGHGWEQCPKDQKLAEIRKEKFGPMINRIRIYSRSTR
jgi:hypothetical protein